MTRITVSGHHMPHIDVETDSYSRMLAQVANIRCRPAPGLLVGALGHAATRYGSPTDAARCLYSDDGDFSGRRLQGKAKRYGGSYVRRRRALAARAQTLGLGRLIRIYPGHGNGRLVWRWSEIATERCQEIITAQEPLTAVESEALAALAA